MTKLAAIGDNNPPDPIEALTTPFEDDRAEAENWLDGTAVETAAQMAVVDALRGSMRQWRLGLERGQKDATSPIHDIYKREMERWKPTIADAKRIEDGLVACVDVFKRKLAAEKEVARKEAGRLAWEATRAAQEAARLADASNIEATRAAAKAMDEAETAQRAAMDAKKDTVKGLRTVHHWRWVDIPESPSALGVVKPAVTGQRRALNWIAANDRDAITDFITAYVKANFKDTAIDGVEHYTEKESF